MTESVSCISLKPRLIIFVQGRKCPVLSIERTQTRSKSVYSGLRNRAGIPTLVFGTISRYRSKRAWSCSSLLPSFHIYGFLLVYTDQINQTIGMAKPSYGCRDNFVYLEHSTDEASSPILNRSVGPRDSMFLCKKEP